MIFFDDILFSGKIVNKCLKRFNVRKLDIEEKNVNYICLKFNK